MSTLLLDRDQVSKAVSALISFNARAKAGPFSEDPECYLWLTLTFKVIPNTPSKPYIIPLPHGLYSSPESEICLITKDPQDQYEALIKSASIPANITVISCSKLRKEFAQYEMKRKLCDQYDLFLVDDRVVPVLPRLIGKTFYQKKKKPIAISLVKESRIAKEIIKARDSTSFFIGNGCCSAIKIGHTALSVSQIVDNVLSAAAAVSDCLPRKSADILSFFLKTSDSVALPIFNSLPEQPHAISLKRKSEDPLPTKTEQAPKRLKSKMNRLKGAAKLEAPSAAAATASEPVLPSSAKKLKALSSMLVSLEANTPTLKKGAPTPTRVQSIPSAKTPQTGKKAQTPESGKALPKPVTTEGKKRKAPAPPESTAATPSKPVSSAPKSPAGEVKVAQQSEAVHSSKKIAVETKSHPATPAAAPKSPKPSTPAAKTPHPATPATAPASKGKGASAQTPPVVKTPAAKTPAAKTPKTKATQGPAVPKTPEDKPEKSAAPTSVSTPAAVKTPATKASPTPAQTPAAAKTPATKASPAPAQTPAAAKPPSPAAGNPSSGGPARKTRSKTTNAAQSKPASPGVVAKTPAKSVSKKAPKTPAAKTPAKSSATSPAAQPTTPETKGSTPVAGSTRRKTALKRLQPTTPGK